MDKTIKQIADELGVSKQAVQKRIAREPLYTRIQPYISTVNRVKYIEYIGENLIKQAFLNIEPTTVDVDMGIDGDIDKTEVVHSDVYSILKITIDTLQEQLLAKDKQLEEKDKQISELTATIKIQAESINADRHNELATTLIEAQEPKFIEKQQKSFLQRFFGKNNKNK